MSETLFHGAPLRYEQRTIHLSEPISRAKAQSGNLEPFL
ncbi:conserved hypothetical protein [delta proteobacterium NaphS2]|nr:conserved hypothetical protein [delta proteobacterium NaphS2]